MSAESVAPDLEPVMLSALQHYLFCPRQCALIHVERAWSENYLTATGRLLHERVDRRAAESRRDVHIATALRLSSEKYGLVGVADMVEFHRMDILDCAEQGARVATELPRLTGWWRPFPVEYKRGRPKGHSADEVQLCAQALCLEEMLNVSIRAGALFYGEIRRRQDVEFNAELRAMTISTVSKVREMLLAGHTPAAMYSKACDACSMVGFCWPKVQERGVAAREWIDGMLVGI